LKKNQRGEKKTPFLFFSLSAIPRKWANSANLFFEIWEKKSLSFRSESGNQRKKRKIKIFEPIGTEDFFFSFLDP